MPRARSVSHPTLVPLGQPEKAMGHESPIEPWLAPDNRAACGLRTDWLRRAQVMKTAGRENQTRCLNEAASRDHGTEGHSNPAPWGGLEGKKTSGRRRSVFFLTPFIELIRHFSQIVIDSAAECLAWTTNAGSSLTEGIAPSSTHDLHCQSSIPTRTRTMHGMIYGTDCTIK